MLPDTLVQAHVGVKDYRAIKEAKPFILFRNQGASRSLPSEYDSLILVFTGTHIHCSAAVTFAVRYSSLAVEIGVFERGIGTDITQPDEVLLPVAVKVHRDRPATCPGHGETNECLGCPSPGLATGGTAAAGMRCGAGLLRQVAVRPFRRDPVRNAFGNLPHLAVGFVRIGDVPVIPSPVPNLISSKRSGLVLFFFLAVTFLAPLAAIWSPPGEWYAALNKPPWNPPAWLFGPVWTMLYISMAVAAWLVWRRGGGRRALGMYGVQLALNAAWSPLFFGLKMPGLAFVEIILLLAAAVITARIFARYSRVAALLFVPYIAWVSFAAFLNFTLWRLNA